uniref:Uncharacterized protein n=1 Tax=Setaria viridis TaxID=4556 RepID=A0A4U6TD55_SETVI|nr:hypothetical protein SEVIR_8G083201v2 [Setaria viridis]
MMLYTVRFLCSVVAAFARLVRELRKAIAAMAASSAMMSPIPSAPKTAAVSPVGLIATTPLPLRKKALATVTIPEMKLLAALAPPPQVVAPDVEVEQQMDSKRRRKADWLAGRRPSRLVLPVADDAGEVAAGWGAAAAAVKEADVEVEGEGFWVASRAGPRHAMEDAYSVITGKNGGDSQLVRFLFLPP